jgi:exosortase
MFAHRVVTLRVVPQKVKAEPMASILIEPKVIVSASHAQEKLTVSMWLRDNLWQVAVPLALTAFLYRHAFVKLVDDWINDPNYSHGFVVPLASIWIIWSMRETLGKTLVEPKSWGLLVMAFAVLQLLAGTLGAENFVAHCSLLVLLAGLTVTIFGTRMFRHLLFPIAWLIFMVPLPAIIFYSITFPLQLLASRMASRLLDFLHITNLREGNVMYFSHYTIGVVEACSGIRSLITLLAFAVLLGHLRAMRPWAQVALAACTVPVALVFNAIRVASAGVLGNYLGEQWAEGIFHTASGIVLFLGGLSTIALISALMIRWGQPRKVVTI